MIRTLLLSLTLLTLLAGCSRSAPADPPDLSDPFAALLPWEGDLDGVESLPSGVQYYVLSSGDDSQPTIKANQVVVTDYDMRFASDGAAWDSSEERGAVPAIFGVQDRLPGWAEALQRMRPGDEWMIYTPAAQSFGEDGAAGIPPGTDFLTRLKVLDVKDAPYPDDSAWDTYTPWNAEAGAVQTTESGLQYVLVKSGPEGGPSPNINDSVVVHYEGRLAETGEKFDASFDRGRPTEFPIARVIPGWTEAMQFLKPGDEAMLYIPSALAYGEQGRPSIPPNSDLIFKVDLFQIKPDDYPGNDIWATYTPWDPARDGVQTTESGLQYVVLASGPADGASPGDGDTVNAHYDGRLAVNGLRFDGSLDNERPASFQIGRVIQGWNEVLKLMRPGDDWLVYIPAELGYGERGTPGGPIPPNADLIFRVNLDSFVATQTSDTAAWDRLTPWDSDGEGVQKTASGLEYVVLESGDASGAQPTPQDRVMVFYEGRLASDGSTFDSAYARGQPATFGVTQVIAGWTEALQLMRPGDRWMVYLPAEIAYGATGRPGIPENSDLIFEVQMMGIE